MPPEAELRNEAVYLYRSFFADEPPPDVIERYIAANRICCPGDSELMRAIVARELDAEAVELALRRRNGRTVLTTKIQVLFYLLEVRSAYYQFFVGDEESRLRAASGLIASVLQTAWKYAKGGYLVRKYELV